MEFVTEATWEPRVCCITHWGPDLAGGRLLDTEETSELGERCYISDAAMERLAPHFDFVKRDALDEALARARVLEGQVEVLEGELSEAQRLVDAIDAIESADFRARKKPGRPKKTPVKAGA